jgi:hypothetical protein
VEVEIDDRHGELSFFRGINRADLPGVPQGADTEYFVSPEADILSSTGEDVGTAQPSTVMSITLVSRSICGLLLSAGVR